MVNLTQVRLAATASETRDSTTSADPLSPIPQGAVRPLPPLDVRRLVRDPEVHAVLSRMLQARRADRGWRGLMRERSEILLG